MELRNIKPIKVLVVFFIFSCISVLGNTYYVSKSGNNSNKGSETESWLTIQYAVDNVNVGDTILVREGTYNETVTFNKSGSQADGYIVLKNYEGEKPLIDGKELVGSTSGWPTGIVRILNKNYIKVVGFEILNFITSNNNYFPAGIWVRGTSHHIEILNNEIHHIEHNGQSGAHGIAVYGTSGSASINNILIEGNEVRNCKLYWSESLVLNGNVEDFVVKNNVVHDNDNIAFDFIGHEGECSVPSLDQARNGLVIGNTAYNIDSRFNPAYGGDGCADGFYVDGGKDILLERNEVYNCNIGIEIASEHENKSTSGITLRNNYSHNNIALGLAIGGYDSDRGSAVDCEIVNNTFYKNNTGNADWGSEILLQYYCENNIIKNNIVYSNSNTPLIDHSTNTGSNNTFDNNLYYASGSPKWCWGSGSYNNFSSYQSASSQGANSMYANPKLENPINGNPGLEDSSPAVDKGDNLSADIIGTKDFFRNARIFNDVIDIGAVEVNSSPTSVDASSVLPKAFNFYQNYPNPFNSTTKIKFTLYRQKRVTLKIYDISGNKIINLVDEIKGPGSYIYSWEAKNKFGEPFPTGIYFVKLQTNIKTEVIKILMIK